jgi:menaquinone-dependent protoporphyrinogen IX oxidase
MPLDFCHPEAPHKKLRIPEWFVSSLMLDRALDAIVRRVKKLDRAHDIPYLAGYSRDGKTIYIDRHMPKVMKFRGQEVDTDRFLILHEEVEKTLIDQLDLHYLHAHQIATRAEEAAVRAAGIRWRDYDRFMQKYVKKIGDERLKKVPADLDLKPYRDEHDFDLMQRMSDCVAAGKVPKSIDAVRVKRALERHQAQLHDRARDMRRKKK